MHYAYGEDGQWKIPIWYNRQARGSQYLTVRTKLCQKLGFTLLQPTAQHKIQVQLCKRILKQKQQH